MSLFAALLRVRLQCSGGAHFPLVEAHVQVDQIPVSQIVEDPDQPRKRHDAEALEGLAESIRQHGVLQPVTVVNLPNVNMYRIVTGERRWRAAQQIGLDTLPCVIVDNPGEDAVAIQLVENLQREDLQPIEKATAIKSLKARLDATNKEVAQRVGVSERMVGYLLDLLDLPEDIGTQVISSPNKPSDGQLTEKHARFLRMLNDEPELQRAVVGKIKDSKLNSDSTGRLVKALREKPESADDILASDPGEWAIVGGKARLMATSDDVWQPPKDDSTSPIGERILNFVGSLDALRPDSLPHSEIRKVRESLASLKLAVDGLIRECDLELQAVRN
jgi:ParB family chromosome partitioning protein